MPKRTDIKKIIGIYSDPNRDPRIASFYFDLYQWEYSEAINGMLQALGDEGHTRFLTPEEVNRQQTDISGKFYGIGAQVGVKDGLSVIIAPMDGSPADQAGIKAGDIIMEVDGEDVTMLQLYDVIDRIRGEEGTEVKLTMFRPDTNQSLKFTIVRAEIKLEAASWAMLPGTQVALIRLTQFNANAYGDVVKAIKVPEEEPEKKTGPVVMSTRSPYTPGGMKDLIDNTSQLKDTLNQQQLEQQQMMEQMFGK